MTNTTHNTNQGRHEMAAEAPLSFTGMAKEVLDELNELGFDKPMAFMQKHGPQRINRALVMLRAKPAGTVKNPAGMVRTLVELPHRLPAPRDVAHHAGDKGFITDPEKFQKQKFGHMVQR